MVPSSTGDETNTPAKQTKLCVFTGTMWNNLLGWTNNISIRKKLFLGFGTLLTLFLITLIYSLVGSIRIHHLTSTAFPALNKTNVLKESLSKTKEKLTLAFQWTDAAMLKDVEKDVQKFDSTLNELKRITHDKALDFINQNFSDYVASGVQVVESAIGGVAISELTDKLAKLNETASQLSNDIAKYYEAKTQDFLAVQKKINRIAANFRNTLLILIIVSLFTSTLMAHKLVQQLSRPLSALKDCQLMVAKGDLTQRVAVASNDELGQLAGGFNDMTSTLQEITGSVRQMARKVGESSHHLSEITQQVTVTISQLSQVIAQIAQSASHVARNSQLASESTQSANNQSHKGQSYMTQLIDKIKSIEGSVTDATTTITVLGLKSSKIGEIVDVITKIADQTNLLSLNAAIEAARAGENGRGFAVVADEVKKLAEHSAKSADEISRLIKEVQDETKKAVTVMKKGSQDVTDGATFTQEVVSGFNAIVDAVSAVNQQVGQIAAIAQQTAASTQEASASSEEQTAAIEEISANAQVLADSSNKLESLVAHFKVN